MKKKRKVPEVSVKLLKTIPSPAAATRQSRQAAARDRQWMEMDRKGVPDLRVLNGARLAVSVRLSAGTKAIKRIKKAGATIPVMAFNRGLLHGVQYASALLGPMKRGKLMTPKGPRRQKRRKLIRG